MSKPMSRQAIEINEAYKRKIRQIQPNLITWAFKNESFKRELLKNPKLTLEKELGNRLPENIEIKILEETNNTLYMVLPRNPYGNLTSPIFEKIGF